MADEADQAGSPVDSAPSKPRQKQSWWDIPLTIGIALAVVLLLTTFIAKPFSIPSGSMEETLGIGDRILVNRLVYHTRPVERGDVIVFDGSDVFVPALPAEDGNPIGRTVAWIGQSLGLMTPDSTDFVKRVIGVGGDHVVCCDVQGRITVNGQALDEESYIMPGDVPSTEAFDVVVPDGKLWVMGDHRSNSADSRAHMGDPGGGFVPASSVVGRAMVVLWPIPHISTIPIPETFAAVPTARPAES